MILFILIAIFAFSFPLFEANTECVWATGIVQCNHNQSRVIKSIVEVWDLDSPQDVDFKNPVDPDDKAGFYIVENEDGLFKVEGCASDFDWIPGIKNRPEFYIRVYHTCNSDEGEFKTVMPIFRVYVPETYDYHINNPIILDD